MARKILIADDEPDVTKILGLRLKAGGYDVVTAQDGEEAIRVAHEEKPDLIILDVRMPGKDGYAVFQELRAVEDTKSIPVLFFSALQPEQFEQKAIPLGANGFISKSVDPAEILSKIAAVLTKEYARPLQH